MARAPKVTRTVIATIADVLCLDIESGMPFRKTVRIARTYKTEEKLLEAVRKVVETSTVKAVHIVEHHTNELLYEMPLQAFLDNATPVESTLDEFEPACDSEQKQDDAEQESDEASEPNPEE